MSLYSIKDLQTLSGIKAHTIRMWEKRYDLLQPSRNENQKRSYDSEELKKLLNISILYNAGWKISKIAALSKKEIQDEMNTISQDYRSKSAVVTLFIEALLAFDHIKFERILNKTIEKEGFEAAYINYLLPFLERIGVLWILNTISPAQEHFISNIIRQKMIVAINQFTPVDHSDVDYLLFTPSGEFHEIGLLYHQLQLCKKGNNVIYLGVDVPVSSVIKTIEQLNPKNLLFSMVVAQEEYTVNAIFTTLRNATPAPLFVSGSFIEQIKLPKVGNVFYAKTLFNV